MAVDPIELGGVAGVQFPGVDQVEDPSLHVAVVAGNNRLVCKIAAENRVLNFTWEMPY